MMSTDQTFFDKMTQIDNLMYKSMQLQLKNNELLQNMNAQLNSMNLAMGQNPTAFIMPDLTSQQVSKFVQPPQIGNTQMTHIVDARTDEILKITRSAMTSDFFAIPPLTPFIQDIPFVQELVPASFAIVGVGTYGTSSTQPVYDNCAIVIARNSLLDCIGSMDIFGSGMTDATMAIKGLQITAYQQQWFDLTSHPIVFRKNHDTYKVWIKNADVAAALGYLYQQVVFFDKDNAY